MTVCRFYQQGYCRSGNACKFEHPPKGGQQNYNNNRFGPLSGQSNQGMSGRPAERVAGMDLSCYSPGKDAPEQLWGGYPREQSVEEIRLHFMMGAMAGNLQGALNDIQMLHQNAQQQIQHTLSNVPMAIQYIVEAGKNHPNRIDVCKGAEGDSTTGGAFGGSTNAFQQPAPPANPFGAPATPATTGGAFGQPAALGQKPNPFGTPAPAPAFGQHTQPAASGFGQPAAPAFGQPAALGGSTPFGGSTQPTSAFGQTATLGAKPNPFGAPTQTSAPAFGQSGFGQPAALGAKPNPFGAAAGGGGAFSSASQSAPTNSPFGQPAQQPQQTQSTSLPFGQTANNQPAANPFGQPAAQPAAANPFGQPATAPANPFGQPPQQQQPQQQQPATNPFGAPAATAAPANPFGQPATSSPFSTPAATTSAAAPAPNPFSQPSTSAPAPGPAGANGTGPYGPDATRQHPDLSTYAAQNPDKTLRMFKGKPVLYEELKPGTRPVPVLRNFDGSMVRIWMPNGAPAYTTQTEAEPEKYQDPTVMQQWKAFVDTGKFAGGIMPEVPPKREFSNPPLAIFLARWSRRLWCRRARRRLESKAARAERMADLAVAVEPWVRRASALPGRLPMWRWEVEVGRRGNSSSESVGESGGRGGVGRGRREVRRGWGCCGCGLGCGLGEFFGAVGGLEVRWEGVVEEVRDYFFWVGVVLVEEIGYEAGAEIGEEVLHLGDLAHEMDVYLLLGLRLLALESLEQESRRDKLGNKRVVHVEGASLVGVCSCFEGVELIRQSRHLLPLCKTGEAEVRRCNQGSSQRRVGDPVAADESVHEIAARKKELSDEWRHQNQVVHPLQPFFDALEISPIETGIKVLDMAQVGEKLPLCQSTWWRRWLKKSGSESKGILQELLCRRR
ncbi:hypothetical protein CHGG_02340 [Chaetomium globosum CBS 148.51]|uniref:C3H1-type domain-containing protein n=1 Tax=Chaetomium globosum (strain ATCC 6205 / CBS 148.51 / DSM 1962 / NBRC 6347 / NRRL 1970) TaxID=306901 RepID=Q2HBR4_CHAGB|nr:uncharacterized protein CHGG_02340 [Chaetomium globosum CBS 148.51]EAQ90405.1 hypothetical protein CHGG_02340 [Chaetomium globosum CBS 148.51]